MREWVNEEWMNRNRIEFLENAHRESCCNISRTLSMSWNKFVFLFFFSSSSSSSSSPFFLSIPFFLIFSYIIFVILLHSSFFFFFVILFLLHHSSSFIKVNSINSHHNTMVIQMHWISKWRSKMLLV